MPATKAKGAPKSQKVAIDLLGQQVEDALRWSTDREISELIKRYERGLRDLSHDLQLLYSKYSLGHAMSYSDYKRFQLDIQVAKIAGDRLGELGQDLDRGIERAMIQQYLTAYERYSWMTDSLTPPNVDIDYQLPSELGLRQTLGSEWKGAMFSDRIGAISDEAARNIQTQFERSLISGESAYELGRRIRDQVGIAEDERLITRPLAGKAKWRADMIARTELMRASNLAQRKVYDDNRDIVMDRIWTTRPPNQYLRGRRRLCPFCEARRDKSEDEVRRISKKQGLPLEPPIHPHCSCIWRLEPKPWKELMSADLALKVKFADEFAMKYRDPESGEIMNYSPMSFEDWKKEYIEETKN